MDEATLDRAIGRIVKLREETPPPSTSRRSASGVKRKRDESV